MLLHLKEFSFLKLPINQKFYQHVKILSSILFLFCSSALLAQHCISERYSENALFDSAQIVIQNNVEYGVALHQFTNQNVSLVMDVYYPDQQIDGLAERPFILMIHGGGFIGGDKNELSYESIEFARRGFVVANINYRVGWNCDNVLCINCFGSNMQKAIYCAVQDARAAMRFAYDNKEEWGIDSNWIFMGGESAGSITAMHATFWDQTEAETNIPAGFSAVAGGLNDTGNVLPNLYEVKALVNHCGAMQNLAHLDNNPNIPIISFHDGNDCVVPYGYGSLIACFCQGFLGVSGSSLIHAHQKNAGQCTELHTAPQVLPNHCTYPSQFWMNLSCCFLKRAMCGYCINFADDDIYATPICSNLANTTNEILGCTYANAINYNPAATADDGSCAFSTNESCAGDFDLDGVVDMDDLLQFIAAYGSVCPN